MRLIYYFALWFFCLHAYGYSYDEKEIILKLSPRCSVVESIYSQGKLLIEFRPNTHVDAYIYPSGKIIKGKYQLIFIELERLLKEKGLDIPILKFNGLKENEVAGELALMLSEKKQENIIVFDVYDNPLRLRHLSGDKELHFAGLSCQLTSGASSYQIFIDCQC